MVRDGGGEDGGGEDGDGEDGGGKDGGGEDGGGEDEGGLFLTHINKSLLGVRGVRLQDKLNGVRNATLVNPHHRRLEDNLRDPVRKSLDKYG